MLGRVWALFLQIWLSAKMWFQSLSSYPSIGTNNLVRKLKHVTSISFICKVTTTWSQARSCLHDSHGPTCLSEGPASNEHGKQSWEPQRQRRGLSSCILLLSPLQLCRYSQRRFYSQKDARAVSTEKFSRNRKNTVSFHFCICNEKCA